MHRTTVWLTHGDAELLREFAFRERRTMSDVIREGIHLATGSEAPRGSEQDDIVSPRVRLRSDDWILSPTEEAVLSLRNAKWEPAAIGQDLALTEEQVLILFERIDAKLAEMR